MNLQATNVEGPSPTASANVPMSLAWQRTDCVGTELVFAPPGSSRGFEGTAVIAKSPAFTRQWQADLDDEGAVRALNVTCRGDGWSRTLRLAQTADGWTARAQETGDLNRRLAAAGRPEAALPGVTDPARLDPRGVVRLADCPIFVTWAMRRLRLTPQAGPVTAPTIDVLAPSMTVLPGTATYQLLSERRLRVTADGHTIIYDLTAQRVVAYRPGRLRLAR